MALSLDSYLHGPFKEDSTFLERLCDTTDEVLPIFYKQTLTPTKGAITWPYAVSLDHENNPVSTKTDFSASTHCMILFALDALSARSQHNYSFLLGKGFKPSKLKARVADRKELSRLIATAKKTLVQKINQATNPLTKSGTYGKEDPFTLTWLMELAFRWTPIEEVTEDDLSKFQQKILAAANRALGRKETILDAQDTGFNEVSSSFLKIRKLHLAKAAKRLDPAGEESEAALWIEANTPHLWQDFDDTIHRQLSYSSMGESKFDPAELALAFEGALLLHPGWVGRYTIENVFEALKLARDAHPHWRPLTPFLANAKGHVLFMVSIEVANSILRSCEILDEEGALPRRFPQIEPQLRSYAMWLLGEVEEIADQKPDKPNFVGWRTEYEVGRNLIQLWHTSHVLVFLVHYESLLKRKIAADGVDAAGLEIRTPKPIKNYWSGEPLRSLAADADQPYAVMQRIKKQFVDSRLGGGANAQEMAPLFSMLLYGPPGTGKTTVAEQLAVDLKWPLVLVTVSDFLASGPAEIENRAKGVFKVLKQQQDVVILFDEIDQFLLDRNSKFYADQDDVFKFMTPGMLTKLQDLRDEQNCVFVVATNYYERVDSAIKRKGRIDEHFLLSIPDSDERLAVLERFTLNAFKREFEDEKKREQYAELAIGDDRDALFQAIRNEEFRPGDFQAAAERVAKLTLDATRISKDDQPADLAKLTALFGWGDLKNLVESKMRCKPGMDLNQVIIALCRAALLVEPAVSLGAYRSRFQGNGPHPFEEFFLLLHLAASSGKRLSASDHQTIHAMFDDIPDFQASNFEYLFEEAIVKEKSIRSTVEGYLQPLIREWRPREDAK